MDPITINEAASAVGHQGEKLFEHEVITQNSTQPNYSILDFDEDDPLNPLNWPAWKRWTIAMSFAVFNLLGIMATVTIIPAAPQTLQGLHTTNPLYRTLLVSIWELGEGINPFFVAPLSERFGRLPVFHVGNLFAVIWAVVAALSVNMSMLVAARFLSGCADTALTLAAVIVGDLFIREERGRAMAIGQGVSIIGEFIAPICGSYIAQAMGWRWTIWINAILFGAAGAMCLVVVRETFAVRILSKKAAHLRKTTGDARFQSKYQAQVDATTILQSITTPMRIMFGSPIVLLITLYTAFIYGTQYVISTTITEILEKQYSFSRGAVGLGFLGRAIGNVLGMIFYALTSDPYIKSKKAEEGDAYRVEHRLIHLIFGAIILPLSMLFYDWTLAFNLPWIVPLVGTGINGFANLLISVATENYLVDAYSFQSASAIAAGVIVKALFGAAYPLIGPPLYSHLGLGWGNTLLAFIVLIFVPFLLVLIKKGDKLRTKDKFAD